jgi:hypothetical protein
MLPVLVVSLVALYGVLAAQHAQRIVPEKQAGRLALLLAVVRMRAP